MTLTTGHKRGIGIVLALGGLWMYREAAQYGLLPRPDALKTVIPLKADTVKAEVLQSSMSVPVLPLPSASPTAPKGPTVRWLVWAWNAQFGLLYSNGGTVTTKASLMEQQGVRVQFTRQDDSNQMQAEQIAFASDFCKDGQEPSKGAHFVTIMGDGAAQYLAPLNDKLAAISKDCKAEVVGAVGYSRNEDKFMGPAEWKANPQAARGGLIAGVLRDGDWNLAMRWAQENNIPNNPDDKLYDPQALNWVGTDSYIDAAQRYISDFSEDLPVKGKISQKQHVSVQGVVTWTPGDVMVAEQRGGLVTLMSTGSAVFQMPAVVIGNSKWDAAHPEIVAGILAAAAQGADQIRNPKAFQRAGEISAQVYGEKDAKYWTAYFTGVSKQDRQGMKVDLGGSSVTNMADMFQLFGLSGGPNLFKATYETFGNIVVQQYPNLLKTFPPTSAIQNTRYLQMAASKLENTDKGKAEEVTYNAGPMKEVLGNRSYSINFETGSARILPESYPTVEGIANDLITTNMVAVIHGHTDGTGTPQGNLSLSEQRAESVKEFIKRKGASPKRLKTIAHGQEDPIASNDTPQGRAQNRRVAIVLGR